MNTLENSGMMELATDTWDSVYGDGGEVELANGVITAGLEQLRYMRTYQPWNYDEATALEGAIRRLRFASNQRERTAEEFFFDAIHEEAR